MFAGPSLTVGHSEGFDQTGLARFFPVYHTLIHIKLQLSMIIFPLLEEILFVYSFRQ